MGATLVDLSSSSVEVAYNYDLGKTLLHQFDGFIKGQSQQAAP